MSNSTKAIIDFVKNNPGVIANLTASAHKSTENMSNFTDQEPGYWAGFWSFLKELWDILTQVGVGLSYGALLLLGLGALGAIVVGFYKGCQYEDEEERRHNGGTSLTDDGAEELRDVEAGRGHDQIVMRQSEEGLTVEEWDAQGQGDAEKPIW